MSTQLIGASLIAAFAVFLIGAGFWLVREFEQPLSLRLRAVAARPRRWIWIHAWMLAGTLVSLGATTLLVMQLRAAGAGWLATTAQILFSAGCVAFLAALAVGLGLTPAAAAATARTGNVPAGYLRPQRFASRLHGG